MLRINKCKKLIFSAALILRICLIIFGHFQDKKNLKFTDVDYKVFTDASQYIIERQSPYERTTYRYTPLLAYLTILNIKLFPQFCKFLFALCDILVAELIFKLMPKNTNHSISEYKFFNIQICTKNNENIFELLLILCFWLFNPIVVGVSSRGNCDVLVALSIITTLYLIQNNYYIKAAFIYGLSIHFRIFPIILAPSIFLNLFLKNKSKKQKFSKNENEKAIILKYKDYISKLNFSLVLSFFFISFFVFSILLLIFYVLYGQKFLFETYLYHLIRRDHRHNFSIQFYSIYLSINHQSSYIFNLMTFLPQIILLIWFSFKFYDNLAFCQFVKIFIFVTFNKVCTSQYFIQYFCLLPISILHTNLKTQHFYLILIQILPQAIQLNFAYKLEFLGQNTFIMLQLSSLAFFIANIFILSTILVLYSENKFLNNMIKNKKIK